MMKKRTPWPGILWAAALLLLNSCEGLFTTSLFSDLKRDPKDMSKEQLRSYGETLLSSGNREEIAGAYAALAPQLPDDPAEDPELYLLACNLALGGSGLMDSVNDLVTQAMDGGLDTSGDLTELYESVLAGVDTDLIGAMVDLFGQLDASLDEAAPESIRPDQYATAALAQAVLCVEAAIAGGGDPTDVDTGSPEWQQAMDWAAASGINLADFGIG
jgi:hypothetical protein